MMTRGSTRAGKTPTPTEHEEQVTLFTWFRMRYAGMLMYAIPNGGARSSITGARLRDEGVLAGVPDIFLPCPSGGKHGLYIEMKRQKGGRVSAPQKAVMQALRMQGYEVAVCHGWQEARGCIEQYLARDDRYE
nr:MAG TPA: Nuclease [Caudoviricetes sp.]